MLKFVQYLAYDKAIHGVALVTGIEGEVRQGPVALGKEKNDFFGEDSLAKGDNSLCRGVLFAAYKI